MKLFGSIIFLICVFCLNALRFDSSKSEILPSTSECGHQRSDDRVTNGTGTEVHKFPWLVYIPLATRTENPSAHVRCAGVLISRRYVLINKSSLQFVLTKVHLGQHDTSKNETCDANGCREVVEVDVEKRIIKRDSEIVLLRLAQDVKFTDFICPICLPFDEFKRAESGDTVYSSGWGLTSIEGRNSLTKKEVKETLVSNESCQESGQTAITEEQICVKVQDDSFAKPCNGDEGSPIMFPGDNKQWTLEGILTWVFDSADKPCAIKKPARGSKITGEVLTWILENIRA